MYVTGAPADGAAQQPLRVCRTFRRWFTEPAVAFDRADVRPRIRTYVSDMVHPYGLALREELVDGGVGHSYGEMAAELVSEVGEPVDLLVLAFAVPDITPGRATAVYLSELCPGRPLALAISDQGMAAGFTGLRLAQQYARTGDCRRALLLVVEQPTLHYHPPEPAILPQRATGVAVLCGTTGTHETGPVLSGVRQHPAVAPEQASSVLAAELAAVSAPGARATVLLGNGLDPAALPRYDVRPAPRGSPFTGVWWELAGTRASADGPLVLADYDPTLRYLCLAILSSEGTSV